MAIPDFQSIMRPLLELAADGQTHRFSEAVRDLAERFQLTPEQRAEMLPSGRAQTFTNRVGWARFYLAKAGLIDGAQRGLFLITEPGRGALAEHSERITIATLRNYEKFREFRAGTSKPIPVEPEEAVARTPEELLEESYQEIRDGVAQELLERIKQNSPGYFERLVVDLLLKMGYGGSRQDAGRAIGRSGDGGIDGVIDQDPLGLDVVYVQAKRWQASVGSPELQAFAGSLESRKASKGVIITTSKFTPDAQKFVTMIAKRIVLIDGQRLAELMIDHGVGVTLDRSYELKKVDLDYFEDT